nr:ThiF family adenylyltransferase [Shewanella algae]
MMRSGVDCGRGIFHIFDPDEMKPQNASRHILGTQEFGENKAKAMASKLRRACHLAINIEGNAETFSITLETLRSFDFIIDATGRPPI